jgi:hypothetical protein
MAYTIIQKSGTYYVAVPTTTGVRGTGRSAGVVREYPNNYSYFIYIFENPVTPVESLELDEFGDPALDEEGNEILVITWSKQELRLEPIRYLESGGVKVIELIGDKDYWLIKMPTEFLIDSGYQPGVNKPKAEEWQVAGTIPVREDTPEGTSSIVDKSTVLIPKRAFDYAQEFEVRNVSRSAYTSGKDVSQVRDDWRTQIAVLLNQKY